MDDTGNMDSMDYMEGMDDMDRPNCQEDASQRSGFLPALCVVTLL